MRLEEINGLTKAAYEKTADKYHAQFRNEMEQKEYDRVILDRFSAMLGPKVFICDAGCGPSGHIGKYLAEKGHNVKGIDISQRCVDIASAHNLQMSFEVMDMMKTTFEDGSLDAILSFYSIVYTPKEYVEKLFSEFNRILKVNGKLLVVVKRGTNEGIIDDEWYEGNKVYFTQFLESEIQTYFSDTKFNIDFIDTRKPYNFEFNVERIYAIGTKKGMIVDSI